MTIYTEYIILFYGFGIPLFYAIHKFTIHLTEKRQRKALQLDNELPQYTQRQQQQKPQINIFEQKYNRIKETIENDNISTQDRITIAKSVIKKK